MQQSTHKTTPFEKREFPVVIICDGVRGPANIGSLFRVSDAFGVAELLFCDSDVDFNSPRMRKTARDTHNKVNYSICKDAPAMIREYREAGYLIISLEITSHSSPIDNFRPGIDEKIALVVGNEQHGVSEECLRLSDDVYHIEMFGENSSINVSHATAIALYHITSTNGS